VSAITPAAGSEWERFRTPGLAEATWADLQRKALLAAAAGIGLFALAAVILLSTGGISTRQLFLSYMVGFHYWFAIGLGSLVVLMLQYVTGGAWGIKLRRILESASLTLPLLLVLFLPVVAGMSQVYPWVKAEPPPAAEQGAADKGPHLEHEAESSKGVEHREPVGLGQKAKYLNVPFFLVRLVIYFAIWLGLMFMLNRWGTAMDQGPEPRLYRYCSSLSAPGLVAYGLTITFASIDWVMSLEPEWYSTIYPVMYAVSQILTAFTFAVLVLLLLSQRTPLADLLRPGSMRDLGSLMLAFVMFWAYMSFSQFLLIWVGNMPEETKWYMRRGREGWQYVVITLALLHFALPFFLLLMRDIKQNVQRLALVAGLVLAMRFLDMFWWIEPAAQHARSPFFWLLDLGAWLGVGGIWTWWFLAQLKRRPLLPLNDPYLAEALHDE
jgi:hypothetical protein